MRRRNMYYATGLPGWMRFGYSPGWVGRSASGLGPCAEYLMTGQWPNPAMAAAFAGQPQATPNVAFLEAQASMLEQQLAALRQQIADLKGED